MASGRVVSIAFVLVVVAFIGSTIWSQRANQRASVEALHISRDAAPEIEALASTRAKLRQLEATILRRVAGEVQNDVPQVRRELEESLQRDRALVTGDDERKDFDRLQAAVQDLDRAAERAIEQARLGAHTQATRTVRIELRRLADAADAAAAALVDLEAQRARAAAESIDASVHRANAIAFRLDAVAAALTVLAALLALRTIRAAERAKDEQRRLVERKAEELEMFAARVAHDILSPLNTVSLALSVAERAPGGQQATDALARAGSSLRRVTGIVDGLFGFARAGALPEPAAVAQVAPVVAGLQEELAGLARQENAALVVEPFEDCAVACSTGVLLSLLSNLLRNAFKYLGDAKMRVVTLRVRPRRGLVRFEVQDTGPGIPAAIARNLFQPYVRAPRTGKPGIGLGLATVKRLIDSHGGAIAHEPAAGGGALFWFELSSASLAPQAAEPPLESPARGA